jgi:deoxyribonuclease-4
MAGKGSELGKTFEEIKYILDHVNKKERLGVCLDTCHIFDGGYDIVNDLEGVLARFDAIIGIDKMKVIHVNDSKNTLGSHKDRHANIGAGNIGYETLAKIVWHPLLMDKIKILETPYIDDNAPYKEEIELLRKYNK